MRRLIFILLILATVALSGCISNTKTFSGHGVTFEYPQEWSEKPANEVSTSTIAYVFNESDNNTCFGVRKLVPEPDGINLNSLPEAVNSFKTYNQNTSFSLISEKPVTINGLKGQEFIYTVKDFWGLGALKKDKAVLLEKTPGKAYYLLIGESSYQYYDEYEPLFDKIINSFKLQ